VTADSPVKRLSIIVPYRAREEHFNQFVPHLRAYFARDKLDSKIPYRVLFVEQEPGLPFNRGALNNIGFALTRHESDYVCFHDVDYLPIWADYSWSDAAGPIIWHGVEHRPIAREKSDLVVNIKPENFFGAVILMPNEVFARVNGFSNKYWGWGWEDIDLKERLGACGFPTMHRKGTFKALYHDNAGFQPDGKPSPVSVANRERFERAWTQGRPFLDDGLSGLSCDVQPPRKIYDVPEPERAAVWEIVTVRLKPPPDLKQV
jgi:hypothetical protein